MDALTFLRGDHEGALGMLEVLRDASEHGGSQQSDHHPVTPRGD